MTRDTALIEAAHRISQAIRKDRDFGEQHRKLSPEVLAALHESQLFRMMVPAEFGGLQTDPLTPMKVVEAISTADGSAGWSLMIGTAYGVWASRLGAQAAREIYSLPKSVVAGALRPSGKARAVDGGFVATGRWPFASGISHSNWWLGNCVVHDGDSPRKTPEGAVETRLVFFPASQGQLIDTWTVGGMRGTGSHDYAIKDLFVPIERTIAQLFQAPSRLKDPLYQMPIMALLDSAMAAVPLGIARAAIDSFVAMAATKSSQGTALTAANRSTVQADVGRAEAAVQAARAWLYGSVDEAWQSVTAGRTVGVQQALLMRLARTHAVTASLQAVDLVYSAAGSASVYSDGLIDRCFRDVHVAAQHVSIHASNYELCGSVLLGLPPTRAL
jgi:alkylation response protein AidB-like acyl-CoA dehydrogenase